MPYDPHLADRMRTALARRRGIAERAMFGGFMFRVGKELEAKALAKPGAEPIVFSGRRMGGLVWVDEEACRGRALARWIELASRFVGTLPPK